MNSVNIIVSEDHIEGTEATISQWLYSTGDYVEKNQPIVELETDKVMMEIIAPDSGYLRKVLIQNGDSVAANSILGLIEIQEKKESSIIDKAAKIKQTSTQKNEKLINITSVPDSIHTKNMNNSISPSVRRLIKQHNVSIQNIIGTGKNNRVTSRDIISYLGNLSTSIISSEHIPITSMRRNIANHMVESLLHTAPHVTSVFNLDLSNIIKHRKLNKQPFIDQGTKLTFTAYFVAASALAIKSVPLINSTLHQDTIEVFNNINIGIGTALDDKGLIVPVIKNCQNKNLLAIAQDLTSLTDKARNNKLLPSDVKDGTFTISNHGVSGSLIATPIIINQPQSAILGVGKMEKRVVVKEFDGEDIMVIKPMCYVSLTIDHRVLDAHQTNQFLSVFVDILENWE